MIKGHTKIELTDVRSGRTQVVADKHNDMTGALEEIFKPFGLLTNGNALISKLLPIQKYFGGMLCFDRNIEVEQFRAPKEAQITAAGVWDYTNNSANEKRGTYNRQESKIDYAAKTATFVYDFATSQGNGPIGAICLTPILGGFMNDAQGDSEVTTGRDFMYFTTSSHYNTEYGSLYRDGIPNNRASDEYGGAWGSLRRYGSNLDYSVTAPGMFIYFDETTSTALYVIRALDNTNGKITLKVRKTHVDLYTVNLWNAWGDITEPYEETEIEIGYARISTSYYSSDYKYWCSINYDEDNHTLYIVNPVVSGSGSSSGGIGRTIAPGAAFKVWAVNVDTWQVTSYDFENATGETLRTGRYYNAHSYGSGREYYLDLFCYDGYMFVRPYNYVDDYVKIYRIELAHPANIVASKKSYTNRSEWRISNAARGRIRTTGRAGFNNTMWGTDKEFIYCEHSASYNMSEIIGRPVFWLTASKGIVLRSETLMTVNNISPITKTAAQTMKITYNLTEVL